MKYLLDANAVIKLTARHPGPERRFRQQDPDEFGLSAAVRHELYFGAYKSRDVQNNLDRITALLFEIVPFDDEGARIADEVHAGLAVAGTPIDPYDVLIAGQAIARNFTLITNNTRECSRVEGLRIEHWEV